MCFSETDFLMQATQIDRTSALATARRSINCQQATVRVIGNTLKYMFVSCDDASKTACVLTKLRLQ